MSTGLECDIVGLNDGRWFFVLQSGFCSQNAWDWREHAPVVGGPFKSEDVAFETLRKRFGNPGGYQSHSLSVEEVIADPVLKANIERALGRALEMPALPDHPVQVASILIKDSTFYVSGLWMRIGAAENGSVVVEHLASMGATDEPHPWRATIDARRDAAGLDITICVDEGMPEKGMQHIVDALHWSARKIYPSELVTISERKSPEKDSTPSP